LLNIINVIQDLAVAKQKSRNFFFEPCSFPIQVDERKKALQKKAEIERTSFCEQKEAKKLC